MHKNLNAPVIGEIGSVACKIYEKKSSNLPLTNKDVFIEIGPLFGTATESIIRGLLNNITRTTTNKLYVYDSFKCDIHNSLIQKIVSHANNLDILGCIQYKPNAWISFESWFES